MTRRLASLVAFALLLAACGSGSTVIGPGDGDDGASDPSMPSLRGEWILDSLTADGDDVPVPEGWGIGMNIELGRIGGNAGCNSFGGAIDIIDASQILISDMSWTETACEILDFESEYLDALIGATAWSADPDGVTFQSENAAMRFSPAPPPEHRTLADTEWVLDTVYSGDGVSRAATTTNRSLPDATLVIADGQATLSSTDCGKVSFAINYEEGRDGNISIPNPDEFDPVGCPSDESNLLTAVGGVTGATGFMIDQNRLTTVGLPGELVSFRALAE